jgi:hypothetical protein
MSTRAVFTSATCTTSCFATITFTHTFFILHNFIFSIQLIDIKSFKKMQIKVTIYVSITIFNKIFYIFLRYCPPTVNRASVIWPNEQTLVASINFSNKFSF